MKNLTLLIFAFFCYSAFADTPLELVRVEYNAKIKKIVTQSCTPCHNAKAEPAGFLGHLPISNSIQKDHIKRASAMLDMSGEFPNWAKNSSDPLFFLNRIESALVKGTMPLMSFQFFHALDKHYLTEKERILILNWVDQAKGILKSNDQPNAQKVFSQNCYGCHSEAKITGGFAFKKLSDGTLEIPLANSSAGIPYLTPGNPEQSSVYLALLPEESRRHGLPLMPDDDVLNESEIKIVEDWIRQIK
jgi:mono/diheme cytochrome c family protein